MKPRLPVPCPLQPGQSLPGLLSQAVVGNSYTSLGLLAQYFGVTDRPGGLSRVDLRHLAVGAVDTGQLAQFTEHTPEQIQAAALKLGPPCPGGRYDEYVSMHRWRYCPACIQSGKPHQRLWLLPFSTACPEHGCELVDACQDCDRPNAVNVVLMPHFAGCQTFAEARPAQAHEVECAATLNRHLDDEMELKRLLDRLMTAWFLSTSEALRPHYRFSPQLQTVAAMRDLVIRLWPAARSTGDLAAAVETQVEALAERWPRFPAMPTMLVNRAREAGAVLPAREIGESRISLLRDDDPWWLPLCEAAAAAGISRHVMQPLVDRKRVRSKLFTKIGDNGNRHKFRMVDMNHLHEIIDNLYAEAMPVCNATSLTNILMVPLHEVIRDVRSGKMSVFRGEGSDLSELMVSYNETTAFARRQRKPAGTLSARETAKLLGTYHAVVADLTDRRILATHHKPDPRRLLINQESAEAFNREYILVGTLAKLLGLNSTNLAEKLAAIGVQPAPLDALVTIYRRADVESVDFAAVSAVASYETKTGRRPKVDASKVDCPRTKKLIALVNEHGGQSAFCRKFGGSRGTLSSILLGQKKFGPLAARRMEKRANLAEGWFDSCGVVHARESDAQPGRSRIRRPA